MPLVLRNGRLIFDNNRLVDNSIIRNMAPSDINLSQSNIIFSAPANSNIGTLTGSDYDDTTWTWSVDNVKFKTSSTTGSNVKLQRSASGSLTGGTLENVRVTIVDSANNSFSKSFPIVIDANEIPLNITLSGNRIANNDIQNTTVGSFTVNDPDDTVWSWSVDNTKFQLSTASGSTSSLQRSGTGTLVTDVSENVKITITDSANNTFNKSFNIVVFDGVGDLYIQTINVSNFNVSSNSDTTRMIGVLFQKGHIPNGSIAIITSNTNTAINHVVVNQSYYPTDNSLKMAHIIMQDNDITAGNTRPYYIKKRPNASYTSSNISLSYANAIANHTGTMNIDFTNVRSNAQIEGQPLSVNTMNITLPFFVRENYTFNQIVHSNSNGTWYINIGSGYTFNITNGSPVTYQGMAGYSNVRVNFGIPWGDGYMSFYLDWPHMSGNLRSTISESDVSARIELPIDNTFMKRYWSWSMAKDISSGTVDEHIKTYWMTDVYFNSNNTVKNVYVKPVIAQDWYDVDRKYRKDYSANLTRNGVVLASYNNLKHAYQCWWAAVRTDDTNYAARPFCVYGKSSSLNTFYDKDYLTLAECFPAFSNTANTGETSFVDSNVYVALAAFAHRDAIDGTGNYFGRGSFPLQDIHAWQKRTHFAYRQSLVNAYGGHHVFYHVREGNSNTNIVSTGMTMKLDSNISTNVSNTWVSDGMRSARYTSYDGRSIVNDGFKPRYGGTGTFFPTTSDASHAPNWTAWNWFLNGDEDFLQAMYDHAINLVAQIPLEDFSSPTLMHYGTLGSTAPLETWSSIPQFWPVQQRCFGWSTNILSSTIGWWPRGKKEYRFLWDWASHLDIYLQRSIQYMTPKHVDLGFFNIWDGFGPGFVGPWQQSFVNLGLAHAALNLELKGFNDAANMAGNLIFHLTKTDPLKAHTYIGHFLYNPYAAYAANSNDLMSNNDIAGIWITATANSVNNTFLLTGREMVAMANNDLLYALDGTTNPLVANTRYYVRNPVTVSDTITYEVTATVNGSAINITTDGPQQFSFIPKSNLNYSYTGQDGRTWQVYDYLAIARYAAAQQYKRNHPRIDSTAYEKINVMFANTSVVNDPNWLASKVKR